jgi:hypothetical protein
MNSPLKSYKKSENFFTLRQGQASGGFLTLPKLFENNFIFSIPCFSQLF